MTRLAALLLILLAAAPAAPAAAGLLAAPDPAPEAVDATCLRHELLVALAAGEPPRHRLVGWLCAENAHAGQTAILASPTGLADHAYWDWPERPETYSFVRAATAAGFAVFNYDRIGTGESDRPAAALVTLESEAFVAHQLVQALRAGSIGDVAFGKVVLLGNSFGTLLSIFEAETYRDVDGLINTGVFVGPRPQGLAQMFAAFHPAQMDPKFAGRDDIPLGYATTQPGARDLFFHLPAAEASTVALDEALKDTATLGEAATFPHWTPFTRLVDAPVLSVMGDRDFLFCAPVCEPGGAEVQRERAFWGPGTCAEVEIVRDAGHFIQLHPDAAADFHALALDWLVRRVGVDAAQPPTAPCDAAGVA